MIFSAISVGVIIMVTNSSFPPWILQGWPDLARGLPYCQRSQVSPFYLWMFVFKKASLAMLLCKKAYLRWVSNKWVREGAQIWKRPCNWEAVQATRDENRNWNLERKPKSVPLLRLLHMSVLNRIKNEKLLVRIVVCVLGAPEYRSHTRLHFECLRKQRRPLRNCSRAALLSFAKRVFTGRKRNLWNGRRGWWGKVKG